MRLKGGDPFVFARGFEELNYAQSFGLETDVIIGISSVMLPGYYGIPLTCRGVNQSFTVLTATTSEGVLSQEVIHASKYAPTAVIFMGLGKLELVVDAYREAGRGSLPVAIVSNGSLDHGTVVKGTVDDILEKAEQEKPAAPALLIFGEGASEAFVKSEHSDIEVKEIA